MGFFGNLWNSAKTLGKKVLGWGDKAQAIGKKAKTHYDRARVIGQKVSTGYQHGKALYHEARQLDSLDKVMDFAKREAGKGAQYSAAADKLTYNFRINFLSSASRTIIYIIILLKYIPMKLFYHG